MRFILVLIFVGSLLGCAAVTPEKLAKSSRREAIILSEPISTVSYRGLHDVRNEEGIAPGSYVAAREDVDGVYYFGNGRSIWWTNEVFQKTPRLYIGGIFLPHDKTKHPQIFYIFEKEVHTAVDLNAFLLDRMVSTPPGQPGSIPTNGTGVVTNAVGYAIAGAVVDAIIDSAVGSIEKLPPIENADIKQKILGSVRQL